MDGGYRGRAGRDCRRTGRLTPSRSRRRCGPGCPRASPAGPSGRGPGSPVGTSRARGWLRAGRGHRGGLRDGAGCQFREERGPCLSQGNRPGVGPCLTLSRVVAAGALRRGFDVSGPPRDSVGRRATPAAHGRTLAAGSAHGAAAGGRAGARAPPCSEGDQQERAAEHEPAGEQLPGDATALEVGVDEDVLQVGEGEAVRDDARQPTGRSPCHAVTRPAGTHLRAHARDSGDVR